MVLVMNPLKYKIWSDISTFSGDGQTFRQIQRIKENFYHEVEDDVEMIKRTGRTTPIIV